MDDLRRGEVWWADLPEPRRSVSKSRRPVLVIQGDSFNKSRIQTVIVAIITSNLELAEAPGNVLLKAPTAGLARDSVVNVSQMLTLDRSCLTVYTGNISARAQAAVDKGLRTILEL